VDQEQFNSIVALLRGLNSSGTLNTSDLSVLQNAILGVLTDTYTPPQVGQSEDELIMNYAPDLFSAADSGDPIRKRIAGAVMRNEDPLTIQVDLRKILQEQALSGEVLTEDMPTNEEYISLINTYKNQWREFQKQERLNAKEKREADPFLKYGLPAFEERYQATDVNRDVFEKLAADYAKNPFSPAQNLKAGPPSRATPGQKMPDTAAAQSGKKNEVGLRALGKTVLGIAGNASKIPQNPLDFLMDFRDKVPVTSRLTLKRDEPTQKNVAATTPKTRPYAPGEKLRTGAFDAQKAKLAGNTPERMEAVAQALVALLQPKLDASGNTPLKDALAQRGIFSAAAAIPKSPKSSSPKNYTVKGSNVVKTGK